MDSLALISLFPELTLAGMTMFLLLVGAFGGDRLTRPVLVMACLVLLIIAGMVAGMQWGLGAEIGMKAVAGFTESNAFTSFVKIVVLVAAVAALLISCGYLKREEMYRPEFPVLIMLSVLGMMLMVSSANFLMLYLALELQSLALYVLASFRRDATRSTEAGLKYFVLGALASGFLLYGISLLYGFSGSLDFATVGRTLTAGEYEPGMLVGLVFVLAALAFKVSAAPFHMWTPDVYEGAPTPVTAFFSAVPKIAAMGLLLKVLYGPFAHLMPDWQKVVMLFSILSMCVGAFGAIGQNNLKRLLAYSSIGHVGFALMGLAADDPKSVLIYLVFYAVMSLGVFSVLLLMRRDERMLEDVEDLSGISRVHPGLAIAMAALMFSMAGIPPLVGFFTKFYVLMAAVEAQMYVLAIVGALASVVGAFYYLRVVKVMYFDDAVLAYDRFSESALTGILMITGLVAGLGLLLISPLALLSQMAVAALKVAP